MVQDTEKQRTDRQNRALHKFLREVSESLTEQGVEINVKVGADVPFTETNLKAVFQKIAYAQFGKAHTSQLSTKELGEVYEVFNRWCSEQGAELPPFPSEEELALQSLTGK